VADRVDFYFRQRVTEAELDLAFELLEKADHNLASDLGVFGVIAGAIPTQHAPLPDLTLDLRRRLRLPWGVGAAGTSGMVAEAELGPG
jgi:hypothetical protein